MSHPTRETRPTLGQWACGATDGEPPMDQSTFDFDPLACRGLRPHRLRARLGPRPPRPRAARPACCSTARPSARAGAPARAVFGRRTRRPSAHGAPMAATAHRPGLAPGHRVRRHYRSRRTTWARSKSTLLPGDGGVPLGGATRECRCRRGGAPGTGAAGYAAGNLAVLGAAAAAGLGRCRRTGEALRRARPRRRRHRRCPAARAGRWPTAGVLAVLGQLRDAAALCRSRARAAGACCRPTACAC